MRITLNSKKIKYNPVPWREFPDNFHQVSGFKSCIIFITGFSIRFRYLVNIINPVKVMLAAVFFESSIYHNTADPSIKRTLIFVMNEIFNCLLYTSDAAD